MKHNITTYETLTVYAMPIAIGTLLTILFAGALVTFWYEGHRASEQLILEHTQELVTIFKKIDESCGIIGFDHQKNYIDFLNVKAFSGSKIGPMNLKYP